MNLNPLAIHTLNHLHHQTIMDLDLKHHQIFPSIDHDALQEVFDLPEDKVNLAKRVPHVK